VERSGRRYAVVAVGGTFDLLHSGHKVLLRKAFSNGNKVLIGLVTDPFAEHMAKPHAITSYDRRLRMIKKFLDSECVAGRARIVPLNDASGAAASDPSIEALVVSSETLRSGRKINEARVSNGLRPLDLLRVKLVQAQDGRPISTTRIRAGEITRSGRTKKLRE
jgi:pantetheine-phosphate adenylyltransferase